MRRLPSRKRLDTRGREGGRRPLSPRVAALLVPLALTACSHGGSKADEKVAPARSGAVTLVERGEAAVSWVGESSLHLRDGSSSKLGAAVNSTLIGTLAPAAVPSASGAAVAYNSWRGREPAVRIRDLRTGRESILDEGAHSPAWAGDGKLAYFKALEPELRDPRRYLGHVVVRRSRSAPPGRWTSRAGRYVVAGWARGRILFYRIGKSFPDLLVLDGPQRQRLLARGTALVAVSPDGRRAVISRYRASPPLVRVVDVGSGRTVARLPAAAGGVDYVRESGSWVSDLVFAPTATGIAVFRIAGGALRLEQVLRSGGTFPVGLLEPQAAAGGRRVTAWGEFQPRPRQGIPDAGLVECDRVTLRCARAAVASSAAPPRPVYNPSRP